MFRDPFYRPDAAARALDPNSEEYFQSPDFSFLEGERFQKELAFFQKRNEARAVWARENPELEAWLVTPGPRRPRIDTPSVIPREAVPYVLFSLSPKEVKKKIDSYLGISLQNSPLTIREMCEIFLDFIQKIEAYLDQAIEGWDSSRLRRKLEREAADAWRSPAAFRSFSNSPDYYLVIERERLLRDFFEEIETALRSHLDRLFSEDSLRSRREALLTRLSRWPSEDARISAAGHLLEVDKGASIYEHMDELVQTPAGKRALVSEILRVEPQQLLQQPVFWRELDAETRAHYRSVLIQSQPSFAMTFRETIAISREERKGLLEQLAREQPLAYIEQEESIEKDRIWKKEWIEEQKQVAKQVFAADRRWKLTGSRDVSDQFKNATDVLKQTEFASLIKQTGLRQEVDIVRRQAYEVYAALGAARFKKRMEQEKKLKPDVDTYQVLSRSAEWLLQGPECVALSEDERTRILLWMLLGIDTVLQRDSTAIDEFDAIHRRMTGSLSIVDRRLLLQRIKDQKQTASLDEMIHLVTLADLFFQPTDEADRELFRWFLDFYKHQDKVDFILSKRCLLIKRAHLPAAEAVEYVVQALESSAGITPFDFQEHHDDFSILSLLSDTHRETWIRSPAKKFDEKLEAFFFLAGAAPFRDQRRKQQLWQSLWREQPTPNPQKKQLYEKVERLFPGQMLPEVLIRDESQAAYTQELLPALQEWQADPAEKESWRGFVKWLSDDLLRDRGVFRGLTEEGLTVFRILWRELPIFAEHVSGKRPSASTLAVLHLLRIDQIPHFIETMEQTTRREKQARQRRWRAPNKSYPGFPVPAHAYVIERTFRDHAQETVLAMHLGLPHEECQQEIQRIIKQLPPDLNLVDELVKSPRPIRLFHFLQQHSGELGEWIKEHTITDAGVVLRLMFESSEPQRIFQELRGIADVLDYPGTEVDRLAGLSRYFILEKKREQIEASPYLIDKVNVLQPGTEATFHERCGAAVQNQLQRVFTENRRTHNRSLWSRNDQEVAQQTENGYILPVGTLLHATSLEALDPIIQTGNLCGECIGLMSDTDSYPFFVDSCEVTDDWSDFSVAAYSSGMVRYSGNVVLVYPFRRDPQAFAAGEDELSPNSGIQYHRLHFVGLPTSELGAIILDPGQDKDLTIEMMMERATAALIRADRYVPLLSASGQLLFSLEEFTERWEREKPYESLEEFLASEEYLPQGEEDWMAPDHAHSLRDHLLDVEQNVVRLIDQTELSERGRLLVCIAARLHDLGKTPDRRLPQEIANVRAAEVWLEKIQFLDLEDKRCILKLIRHDERLGELLSEFSLDQEVLEPKQEEQIEQFERLFTGEMRTMMLCLYRADVLSIGNGQYEAWQVDEKLKKLELI